MSSHDESSVLISLREIMELERSRVAAEEHAARAAQDRAARDAREAERAAKERVEGTRRREQEQECAREEEEARRRREHEAALLRVRLEVEAQARAERERLDLEHRHALRRLDVETRAHWIVRVLIATVVLGTTGVAGTYLLVIGPSLRASRSQVAEAERLADERAAENVALLRRLVEIETRAAVTPATPTVPKSPAPQVAPAPQPSTPGQARAARRRTLPPRPPPTDTALDGLDGNDDDPLTGLEGEKPPARR